MKKFLTLLLLSFVIIPNVAFAQGQKKYFIEGTVTLFGTSEPIPYANVLIKELNLWSSTSAEGKFKINGIIPGSYTLEVTSLGYQKVSMPVKITQDYTGFKLQMKEENLTLEDVVVTAKAGSAINTSSRIDKTAIQHIQASSLADVMQLLPGNVIANPDLNSTNVITMRSVSDGEAYNKRGVGVFMNGSKLSSDATIIGTKSYSIAQTLDDPFDFRKISTENIESVEVLKGVVSAEYGDLTSGAIIVTTKAGRTPLDVRVKTDPRTKAVSLSKGFGLGKRSGNLNIDFDYARSFKQWISPVSTFDRITYGVTYSNTFNKNNTPLRFNMRFNGYFTGNSTTSDPDVSSLDFTKIRDNNFNLSVYGNWQLNKPYISSLNYNVSASYGKQTMREYLVTTQNPLATTNSKVDGITEGTFTQTLDQRDRRVDEIPIYFNAKLSGYLNKNIGKSLFRTTVGFEFNTKGNNGKGEYYTGAAPQFFRERPYSEIPFLSDLSVFAEEKITVPIMKTQLELSAGVRMNKMMISGYNYDPIVDPRFNAKYTIIKQKRDGTLRNLSLRGGWGIMQRLPSINHLYQADNYEDFVLFQYYNSTTSQRLAVIETKVIDGKLPYNLKPEKTRNIEVGIDFDIKGIKGSLTYFNDKLKDGITSNTEFISGTYNFYNSTSDVNAAPKFENGTVYVMSGGEYVPLGYTTLSKYSSYYRPDNRGYMRKWGIEYDFDFGKIKSLNTAILLSGSYLRNISSHTGYEYTVLNTTDPYNSKESFPYVAVFGGEKSWSNGTGSDRLMSNLNIVTNIPSIRLVVSLTTQFIWMERSWNLIGDDLYTLDSNGQPVYGDYKNKKITATVYRNPVAYIDREGVTHNFDQDYFNTTDPQLKTRLRMMIESPNYSYNLLTTSYNPYVMANIRVTKEIGKTASLSFYSNNFTNSRPIIKNNARPLVTGSRKNTPIYFGAELRLTF